MKHWFKKKYKAFRFRLSAQNHFAFRFYYKHLYKAKTGTLGSYIDCYSKSLKGKVSVLQIGANDGITHDPIHKFIKRDQWSGLLLEPQKDVFDQYLSKLYALDEDIQTMNAALGPQNEKTTIYKIAFSSKRWATGLATFNKEVLIKAFDDGRIERFASKYGDHIPKNPSLWIEEDEIEMLSVETVMAKSKMKTIDLLMIDTEGYDFKIIKLVLAANYLPDCIIFEAHHFTEEEKKACLDLLRSKNYSIQEFDGNRVARASCERSNAQ